MNDDEIFERAFSPERFREDGRRMVDRLAEHLERALAGEGSRPIPSLTPFEAEARFSDAFTEAPSAEPMELLGRMIDASMHQHHPGYVGHQVSCPLPGAALYELAGTLLNNGMAAFESGPANTAMERAVVRWLAAHLGWRDGDGVLTSGGSLGNLTALLVARQVNAGFDVWSEGAAGGPPLAILASADAHYSLARAAAIMGLGAKAAISVAVDERRRMRMDALREAHGAAIAAGRRPFVVVANAGSTVAGAIDPLDTIADFCDEHDLWMHVDGAHGASMLLADSLRGRLKGIERARSVVWDAHKLMLVPSLSTAVLFARADDGWLAFSQEAPYLYGDGGRRAFDIGLRTLECTKRSIGATLYAAITTHGTRLYDVYVPRVVKLAERFGAMIDAASDFELLTKPECNIVCFRYVPKEDATDARQERVRAAVNAGGRFFLVQTRVDGRIWLRTTLTNPATTEAHLRALLDAIRRA
jgi:L-2,4-diaminobutyrate decarboxylase